jgi:hypothetical protein
MDKAKFTFAERCVCVSELSQASQHTHLMRILLSFYLSCKSAPHPDRQVWVHNLCDWLRLRFRVGHRSKGDMIGEHGQKLNLLGWYTQRQRDDP